MGTWGRDKIVAASAILLAGILVGSTEGAVSALALAGLSALDASVAVVVFVDSAVSEPLDWQPVNVALREADKQTAVRKGTIVRVSIVNKYVPKHTEKTSAQRIVFSQEAKI